jgi:hypothetical protein
VTRLPGPREAVLMSAANAERLGVGKGGGVVLRSGVGELRGRVQIALIALGNLPVHWPEGNALIADGRRSPEAEIPDYNAWVRVEAAP